jgi:hypothetical protein
MPGRSVSLPWANQRTPDYGVVAKRKQSSEEKFFVFLTFGANLGGSERAMLNILAELQFYA